MLTAPGFRTAVAALTADDPALAAVVERHGVPSFWARAPGFPTLLLLILEQQVSLASARAAYDRLERRVGILGPAAVLRSSDDELRGDGFSRQKSRYALLLAEAIESGALDLDTLTSLPDAAARAALIEMPGIGPWTAEVYLLSALRRPDTWPSGDIALAEAARRALGLTARPSPTELAEIGERWRPHRASAARLLWHLYLSERRSRRTDHLASPTVRPTAATSSSRSGSTRASSVTHR